ncbi:hypothetical protein KIPB_017144, partial [Kipferlia bialata]
GEVVSQPAATARSGVCGTGTDTGTGTGAAGSDSVADVHPQGYQCGRGPGAPTVGTVGGREDMEREALATEAGAPSVGTSVRGSA